MNIVFIGDVVGDNGIDLLKKSLHNIKNKYEADVCVVNGENRERGGKGLSADRARFLVERGADIITGGNHSLRKMKIDDYEQIDYILCPDNFYAVGENRGVCHYDMGKENICVINLVGTAFLDSNKNPFFSIDEILKNVNSKNILVDFHRESTAEKQAFGYYCAGRVSAVVGTHTHVQTNDARILPGGTAYITDAGCVSAENSVLGIEIGGAVEKQKYLCPVQFKVAKGSGYICGVFINTDKDGRATKIEKIKEYIKL